MSDSKNYKIIIRKNTEIYKNNPYSHTPVWKTILDAPKRTYLNTENEYTPINSTSSIDTIESERNATGNWYLRLRKQRQYDDNRSCCCVIL